MLLGIWIRAVYLGQNRDCHRILISRELKTSQKPLHVILYLLLVKSHWETHYMTPRLDIKTLNIEKLMGSLRTGTGTGAQKPSCDHWLCSLSPPPSPHNTSISWLGFSMGLHRASGSSSKIRLPVSTRGNRMRSVLHSCKAVEKHSLAARAAEKEHLKSEIYSTLICATTDSSDFA